MNYTKQIGDGKLPNKYWVFQYDQKYQNKNGCLEIIKEDMATKDALLGEFKTFEDALKCVDNKAYLPNVVIEDRLSGQIFEQMCIVCPCCKKEEWVSHKDISFTQKRMAELGQVFA